MLLILHERLGERTFKSKMTEENTNMEDLQITRGEIWKLHNRLRTGRLVEVRAEAGRIHELVKALNVGHDFIIDHIASGQTDPVSQEDVEKFTQMAEDLVGFLNSSDGPAAQLALPEDASLRWPRFGGNAEDWAIFRLAFDKAMEAHGLGTTEACNILLEALPAHVRIDFPAV